MDSVDDYVEEYLENGMFPPSWPPEMMVAFMLAQAEPLPPIPQDIVEEDQPLPLWFYVVLVACVIACLWCLVAPVAH